MQPTLLVMILTPFVKGADYLLAFPQKYHSPRAWARSDETGGTLYYIRPNYAWRSYKNMAPTYVANVDLYANIGTVSEVVNRSFIIATSNSFASLELFTLFTKFAPLPTTALGTNYIVSSCHISGYLSLFVIAAHSQPTNVTIKARSQIFGSSTNRENTRLFELKPFHAFTVEHNSDLTGTVVTSTQPIAVFSGMADHVRIIDYEQLLPVRLYDTEYVVAVNDNPVLYHLQVLSEQNGTVITFNNGSSLTVDSNSYQAQLTPLERFYFKSSNPVMVTICRRNEIRSGIMVVPPISLYSLRVAYFGNNYNILMTRDETVINSSVIDINWTHISNSNFKTGVVPDSPFRRTKVVGCNLYFSRSTMKTNGVTYEQPNKIEVRKTYLLALPNWKNSNLLISSSQDASYQVVFPLRNQTHTRQILETSSDKFLIEKDMKVQAGVENKAIRVDMDSKETQLSLEMDLSRQNSFFPTTFLGREYIVQACYGNIFSEFILIIVSSSVATDINVLLSRSITYDDVEYGPGHRIRGHLQPYQTLTIKSSVALCGTSVSASHNVAVITFNRFRGITSHNQLLPVDEYAGAGGDTTTTVDDIQVNITTVATGARGDITTTVDDDHVNIATVAVGTTLSVLILVLLAVIIYQQIHIRRTSAHAIEKTDRRSGEEEPQSSGDVSTLASSAAYSELFTEPQVTNMYERINPSLSVESQYENVTSNF